MFIKMIFCLIWFFGHLRTEYKYLFTAFEQLLNYTFKIIWTKLLKNKIQVLLIQYTYDVLMAGFIAVSSHSGRI